MAGPIIYVTRKDSAWHVLINDTRYGPYSTQADATKAARSWVPKVNAHQILVQGRDSKWITEWTYGKDPYPPAG